jgi:tripartite-type tricarboxylate transporter receptor subunit TctC
MHGKSVLPPQIEAGKLRALAVTAGERWRESTISAFRSLRDELARGRQ